MKKITLSFLWLVAVCMAAMPAYGAVTQQEAFNQVKNLFSGPDADYFILKDYKSGYWTFFVDPTPLKGWEHDCYVVDVSKTTSSIAPTKTKHRMPPKGNYVVAEVKNRYGTRANSKPAVPKSPQANSPGDAASRTYALIISGGVSPANNHERYWNDCSFIYQTLVNKYGVPKANIYAAMSDGTAPDADMLKVDGTFVSQPLDLDGDGTNDIKYAATEANIKGILMSLQSKIKEDDQLFIFVIDHGGSNDENTNSYIWLWDYGVLYDYELAAMLQPFCNKYANVNVVLGQCYAGGFNDDLTKVGCVVSSACKGSEPSYGRMDIPYDEFVYQWTTAINGADHLGQKKNADYDANDHITMAEAFKYAKTHDSCNETPQYVSTPASVGDDLAFTHLAPAVDLYIKDNTSDTGIEPNRTTNKFWNSPWVWCRNNQDGVQEHENPYYTSTHTTAKVYVKIQNRGKKASSPESFFLHGYWTHASLVMNDKAWKGLLYKDGHILGDHIRAKPIPAVAVGGESIMMLDWSLPSDYFDTNDKHHFCLWARIMDSPIDDGYVEGNRYFQVGESNDQAQRNVSIIYPEDMGAGTGVYVANIFDTQKVYSIELTPLTMADKTLIDDAKIELVMSSSLLKSWQNGGAKSEGVSVSAKLSPAVQVTSSNCKLTNLTLDAGAREKIALKITMNALKELRYKTYTFDMVQKDANGNVLGGETFIIHAPKRAILPIEVTANREGNGRFSLGVDLSKLKSVNWQNQTGEFFSEDENVTVIPSLNNHTFTVSGINDNGELAVGTISLEGVNGIRYLSPEGNVANSLDVTLWHGAANSELVVTSVMDGMTATTAPLGSEETSVTLDTSSLRPGFYVINYIIENEVIDSRKFTKK